jgi:hypothetical protein
VDTDGLRFISTQNGETDTYPNAGPSNVWGSALT